MMLQGKVNNKSLDSDRTMFNLPDQSLILAKPSSLIVTDHGYTVLPTRIAYGWSK